MNKWDISSDSYKNKQNRIRKTNKRRSQKPKQHKDNNFMYAFNKLTV